MNNNNQIADFCKSIATYPEDSIENKSFWDNYKNSSPDIQWNLETGKTTYFEKPVDKKIGTCLSENDKTELSLLFKSMKNS